MGNLVPGINDIDLQLYTITNETILEQWHTGHTCPEHCYGNTHCYDVVLSDVHEFEGPDGFVEFSRWWSPYGTGGTIAELMKTMSLDTLYPMARPRVNGVNATTIYGWARLTGNTECECDDNWYGNDCTFACHNGNYTIDDNGQEKCVCEKPFAGEMCYGSCYEQGTITDGWHNGVCDCNTGFSGTTCNQWCRNVPDGDFTVYNHINLEDCSCHDGWTGQYCDKSEICNGNGVFTLVSDSWDDAKCICDEGFGGHACQHECHFMGTDHFVSETSDEDAKCVCKYGWTGDDCSIKCTVGANGWENGECTCKDDYFWPNSGCSTKKCEGTDVGSSCNNDHGECKWLSWGNSGCVCNNPYIGPDCTRSCSYEGTESWYNGHCICKPGYVGDDCSTKCNDQGGDWRDGFCICRENSGIWGDGCDVQGCETTADCTSSGNNGQCVRNLLDPFGRKGCQCSDGSFQPSCNLQCDEWGTKTGSLELQRSDDHYFGAYTSTTHNGTQCDCKVGYIGNDCSIECNGHGQVRKEYIPGTNIRVEQHEHDITCDCNDGWNGRYCDTKTCQGPDDCSEGESCIQGRGGNFCYRR